MLADLRLELVLGEKRHKFFTETCKLKLSFGFYQRHGFKEPIVDDV